MPRRTGTRRFKHSIASLFAPKKTNVTIKTHPEVYYKTIWLTRTTYQMVDFVAAVNRKSKKQTVNDMLQRGLASYIGEQVAQDNRLNSERRRRGLPTRPTPFVAALRALARKKGADISKFI